MPRKKAPGTRYAAGVGRAGKVVCEIDAMVDSEELFFHISTPTADVAAEMSSPKSLDLLESFFRRKTRFMHFQNGLEMLWDSEHGRLELRTMGVLCRPPDALQWAPAVMEAIADARNAI
jgi:hypothetical protein